MTTTASGAIPSFAPSMLVGSWCVETGNGHVCSWNPQFQLYADLGQLQYFNASLNPPGVQLIKAAAITWNTATDLWVVDETNNVFRWQAPSTAPGTPVDPANGWTQLSQLGHVKMVTFNQGTLYGVLNDKSGTVVMWPAGSFSWQPAPANTEDWNIEMIAFDNKNVMYCVAADPSPTGGTRVGVWNDVYARWSSLGDLGDRELAMISFDAANNLWGVDENGGIAYWDLTSTPEQWIEPASDAMMLGLPNVAWLTWQPEPAS
jgi:hypothetical protein